MNHSSIKRSAVWRTLALTTSALLAFPPLADPAFAQTALADQPIVARVAAKPNIVYTVDDSGSMASNYIPDYVTSSTYPAYCRGAIQVNAATGAPFYNLVGGFNNTTTACGAGSITAFNFPPFYAADFNRLAYNPNVKYLPPLQADGTPLTFSVGVITDNQGNQRDLTKVQSDPYLAPGATVDLTTNVNVPVFCHTDWPLIGPTPYNGTSNVAAFAIGDVGDAAGENPTLNKTIGQDCRINGTAYAAAAGGGAPAITDDYNYPWPKVGAAAGAAGVPNAHGYFWRQSGVRRLWCDKGNTNWPQTCNGGWSCTKGGKYTPPATQPQTCYLQSTTMVCTSAPNVYTPAGCNTDPAYDLGGCVASSEQTCLTCVRTNPCVAWSPQSNGACHLTANGGPPGSGGSGAACNCVGAGCILPACPDYTPNPTNANCSKGVLTQKCNPNAGACTDLAFDPVNLVNLSYTLLDDSNMANGGTGMICRHNNFDYATQTFVNQPDNYPSAQFITPITTNCPTIPVTVAIPRHYYTIDSVQFCSSPDNTANGQWNGFGTGACKSENDLTTYKNVTYGQFHRVDLVPGRTYNYVDPNTGLDPVTGLTVARTYADEAMNYANWYAYYRTRILAAKTVSSIGFSYLDKTYRVGFHDLGTSPFDALGNANPAPIWVDVDDFVGTAAGTTRGDWYNSLFNISIKNYSTYTMSAMLRIGNLFEKGSNGGLPATVNPLPATAKDPISNDPITGAQLSCQNNYHILITDGYTNEPTLQAVVGDRDATLPVFVADNPPDNVLQNAPGHLRPPGQAWPSPFVQQTAARANTLSDISTYYWATDLRPGLVNNVPADIGKNGGDIDYTKDVAWWQHVQFSAISFGSMGTLDATSTTATINDIIAGKQQWPDISATPNQPKPVPAVGVDDLWHSTVNSRGYFVYARSPAEVTNGLSLILGRIANQTKTRVGASFSGQVLDATNNTIYESKILPGWSGDLLKVQIDPATGAELVPQPGPPNSWSAAQALYDAANKTGQIYPTFFGDEPWMDEKKRRLVTFDTSGNRVPFRYPGLAAAPAPPPGGLDGNQLATLGATPTLQQEVIAYLRGGSTVTKPITPTTISIEGTGAGQFRQRSGPIGDITNAQPVIVTKPDSPFYDTSDPNYTGYKTGAAASRGDRIVAPANDGIVHVFDSADGHEVFGFIPSALLRCLDPGTCLKPDPTGLQALTYSVFPKHHFYVDSSPRVSDVDISAYDSAAQTHAGTGWRTIVVGGLGKGGNSYYALNLTDGDAADENAAMGKLLWEHTDSDWTTTYGRPIIVKTYAWGWTVIVTSGYNNVSGEGRIYFLNPATGQPQDPSIPYLTTGPISCTDAAGVTQTGGLAQISGFTKDFHNQFVEQVYGGDLCGNLWRFDLSDPNPNNWQKNVVQFAYLTVGGFGQPITTAPQIEIDFSNGVDRYVFVGTGQLLDESDFNTVQQQSMYAIRDGSLATPLPAGSLPRTRAILASVNPASTGPIATGAPDGWYMDLPTGPKNERIVVDVEADVNTVVFLGTQPLSDQCSVSLPATIYARDFATAASQLACTSSMVAVGTCGAAGTAIASATSSEGGVGLQVVGLTDAKGNLTLGGLLTFETGKGTEPVQFLPPKVIGNNRFSWRLMSGQ